MEKPLERNIKVEKEIKERKEHIIKMIEECNDIWILSRLETIVEMALDETNV